MTHVKAVLSLLKENEPLHIDEIAAELSDRGMSDAVLSTTLVRLTRECRIRRTAKGTYTDAKQYDSLRDFRELVADQQMQINFLKDRVEELEGQRRDLVSDKIQHVKREKFEPMFQ